MQDRPHGGRRGWSLVRLVVVCGLVLGSLGATAGSWWGARQAERHEASTVILLNPLLGNPFSPDVRGDDLINLETEAQLVTSDSVLSRLSATAPELPRLDSGVVEVSIPTNTQLLDIVVTSTSDEIALGGAEALALAYLDYRRSRTTAALFNERANIDEQIDERSQERAALVKRLADTKRGSPDRSLLTQQILTLLTQVAELRTQRGDVGAASLDPGQVVTPATVRPPGPLAAGALVPGVLGGLLGLVAGCLLAVQWGRRDDVVHSVRDLTQLDVAVWGPLPGSRERALQAAARMRAPVMAERGTGGTVVLACRAGGAPIGWAEVLAEALATPKMRTLLIELSDRETSWSEPADGPGLTQVLSDGTPVAEAITWSGNRGLLRVGDRSAALDHILSHPEMAVLLLELRDIVDLVVVDAGAATSARSRALVPLVDLVLLEVVAGTSTVSGAEADLVELASAEASKVAIALAEQARRQRSRRFTRGLVRGPLAVVRGGRRLRERFSDDAWAMSRLAARRLARSTRAFQAGDQS